MSKVYSSLQLTANYVATISLQHCIIETDLRITKHRGCKFSPSVTLLSFKNQIEWPLGRQQLQVFRAYFFNFRNNQGNVQAFWPTGLLT